MSILINNAWWWILAAVMSLAVTLLFGKWCSKGVTERDEEFVVEQAEMTFDAIKPGGGNIVRILINDRGLQAFATCVTYLFLWPLLDLVYIILAPTMVKGRKDRLARQNDTN